jgi:hypothetical protein
MQSPGLEDSPLFLTRVGAVDSSLSSLTGAGNPGDYWTSTVDTGSRAYMFWFAANTALHNNTGVRRGAMTVRCVAR